MVVWPTAVRLMRTALASLGMPPVPVTAQQREAPLAIGPPASRVSTTRTGVVSGLIQTGPGMLI